MGNNAPKKIHIKCNLRFDRNIETKDYKQYSFSTAKKKKSIFDYIIHTSERAEDGLDGNGNPIKIEEHDKTIFCRGECISSTPVPGNHGSYTTCAYLDSLKINGAVNSNCGGTVYIPKLIE